jgi:hypothetical protein
MVCQSSLQKLNFISLKRFDMKKLILGLTLLTSLAALGQRASPHDTVSNDNVSVTYGRPYKKGRDVFGGLEKFGQVWRMGADEATTITFKKDVKFGGTSIPAGTYTLFALVEEKEWTFILNGQLGQWGAYGYDKNKDKNLAYAKVPVKKNDKEVEQLTIHFEKDNSMVVEWDKTMVTLPLVF